MAKRTADLPKGVTLTKEDATATPWLLTAYRVHKDGKFIGYVWSREGHSYRGTQGWNRGIRIRDFHPTEWLWGEFLGRKASVDTYSRKRAVERLVEDRETQE